MFEYSVSTPMERAVPAMIRFAASMSLALRSGIFCFAIASSLSLGKLADLLLVGHARALLDAERLLDEDRGGRRLEDEREGLVARRP